MTLHTPVLMQPASGDAALDYSGAEFRNYMLGMLAAAGCGTFAAGIQGVTAAADYAVVQRGAGADLSVDVPAGAAFIKGDDVTGQGSYFVWNDGTVNVPGFTVPASGTFNHRLVLQVQDKLNNGTWTGYQAALTPLLDTGSGTPAEPSSAFTLAIISITSVQTSIQNAQITDWRYRAGPVSAIRTSNATRTSTTTVTDDTALQLLNLIPNQRYRLSGNLFYNGASMSVGTDPGGLGIKFRLGTGDSMKYNALRINQSGNLAGAQQYWVGSDTVTAQTQGTSAGMVMTINGQVATGSGPSLCVLQWAQDNSSATATTLEGGSYLRVEPLNG